MVQMGTFEDKGRSERKKVTKSCIEKLLREIVFDAHSFVFGICEKYLGSSLFTLRKSCHCEIRSVD
jgi:hypothetical protein